MHPLTLYQFEYRLALALVLGAVLGIERQLHHKPAGTKTHALVAVGAALFVLLAEDMPGDASATGRVAAQIITGIVAGFLIGIVASLLGVAGGELLIPVNSPAIVTP